MLLHDLHELQAKHGWLSDETLRTFARERNVPLYELEAVTTFYPHFRRSPPPRAAVTVCRPCRTRVKRPAAERALRLRRARRRGPRPPSNPAGTVNRR